MITVTTDPVLIAFREALEQLYGDRLERLVLFGSRARGDSRPDSDYDVAVFLHDLTDRDAEMDQLASIQGRLIDETDEVIHAMPFPAGTWSARTTLMHEIRAEGLEL